MDLSSMYRKSEGVKLQHNIFLYLLIIIISIPLFVFIHESGHAFAYILDGRSVVDFKVTPGGGYVTPNRGVGYQMISEDRYSILWNDQLIFFCSSAFVTIALFILFILRNRFKNDLLRIWIKTTLVSFCALELLGLIIINFGDDLYFVRGNPIILLYAVSFSICMYLTTITLLEAFNHKLGKIPILISLVAAIACLIRLL